jgi:hypothetical protein
MTQEQAYLLFAQKLALESAAKEAAKPKPIIVAVTAEPPSERPALHRAPAGERLH